MPPPLLGIGLKIFQFFFVNLEYNLVNNDYRIQMFITAYFFALPELYQTYNPYNISYTFDL